NVHRNAAAHPDATSEGVVTNSMVHELDVLPWLTGLPVTALDVRAPHSEGLREPQLATVVLGDGEVLATVEVFPNARYGYDVRCEVVGTSGTVKIGRASCRERVWSAVGAVGVTIRARSRRGPG